MAYTRNFGFRATDTIVRHGRSRVPKTGTAYRIGTAVVENTGVDAGFLTRPGAGDAPTPNSGIVLYEHIQMAGVDALQTTNTDGPFRDVPLGQYAQRVHGPGTKVWFRNTDDRVLADGRTVAGDTLVDMTGIVVGSFLAVAADGTFVAGDAATGWLQVTFVNTTSGLVEAVFTF